MRPVVILQTPDTLRAAWSEWLAGRPWDLFLTLTSDHRTHPEALHKRFCWHLHQISDELYGRTLTRRKGTPIEYVNGIERHKSGWPHSHALLRFPDVDLADPLQFSLASWQRRISEAGGFCWLSRPRDQADVVGYVTKYVTKDGELILSDNLSPTVDPRPALGLVA
jgi:hypothetical protein